MARPHTCFIQAQALPWRKGLYGGGRPDVRSKVLSIDKASGDSTCILRYPEKYRRRAKEYVRAHEEFFVLDGTIKINGIEYGKHAYGFFPAGHVRRDVSSRDGAVLLTTFAAQPVVEQGEPEKGLFDKRLLIEHKNTLEMPWDPGLVDPQLQAGVAIKALRTDPDTGETSFLYSSAAHRIPPHGKKPRWTHSMVEEIFVLDGEYVFADAGVMGPGGYVWWREFVYQGPSGSIPGFNLWIRTVNGPMHNIFEKKKHPMDWNPKHRPKLPADLKRYAKPYAAPAKF